MKVQIELTLPFAAELFAQMEKLRAQAANELVAAQRRADVERMTGVVGALGEIAGQLRRVLSNASVQAELRRLRRGVAS